ncbi:hypothetical protein [Singulisphaera acidiphila]|uniref:Uncharacterized protein n=1 Tax=Singulisphaera acidiphila (strain ATCC BAA-1392 / DSM 18658 / VKM B-2454 / MOB10) TaxID=886293 RepID=L0DQW5_SINAD|nr:hypothetical protein [Singulisphaera acidiphila]AGA31398.1 hypothetical protein Sinac_7359 [Singulisphaera acidiphila DSM 18658]
MDFPQESSGWVGELLRAHRPPSERFQRRCEELAQAWVGIQKLRQAKHRLGLPLLGLPALLRSLAGTVDSPGLLDSVLGWAGLDLQVPTSLASAGAWGRLASALGLVRGEALFYLRLTFADLFEPEPLSGLVAFRHDGGDDGGEVTLDSLNIQLDGLSRHWAGTAREHLKACEQALFDAWDETGFDEHDPPGLPS